MLILGDSVLYSRFGLNETRMVCYLQAGNAHGIDG
jgi:hypothetical protein